MEIHFQAPLSVCLHLRLNYLRKSPVYLHYYCEHFPVKQLKCCILALHKHAAGLLNSPLETIYQKKQELLVLANAQPDEAELTAKRIPKYTLKRSHND